MGETVGKNTKWIAKTNTGSLLSYITNRSMKIVLLPIPTDGSGDNSSGTCKNYIQREEESERMDDFVAQLRHHVICDVVIKNMVENYNAQQIINDVMLKNDKISSDKNGKTTMTSNEKSSFNNKIMIISDRDD